MKRAILRTVLFMAAGWLGAAFAMAQESAATPETWKAEWSNRFADKKGEWVFVWTERAGVVTGTVVVDGVSYAVEGTRNGAWRELSWKNAEGRVTQVRAAGGAGEWRGSVLSGGDGGLVEYGRVSARREG